MKLTEFNSKPTSIAKKALKENFNADVNFETMSIYDTKRMLTKVRNLIAEMRKESGASTREQNPNYLKAIMIEQALIHHYGEIKNLPIYRPTRIVVENEEVEKSQVILAAQEMVDSIQKMVEEVSDMLVKELPAVVDGVNSEVGANEGQQFNDSVSQALTGLQASLTEAKNGLQGALNSITGQGASFDSGMEAPVDMAGGDMEELGGEQPAEELPELPEEPAEEEPVAGLGREKR